MYEIVSALEFKTLFKIGGKEMQFLYITNIPSPYVVDFLNALGKKADVHAVFEKRSSSERDASWESFEANHFSFRILPGISYDVDKAFSPGVIFEIKKHIDSRIVLSNPVTLTGLLAIAYMKAKHIPYSLQVEGGVPIKQRGLKGCIKRFAFSGATHYYSSGTVTDQYLLLNGAKQNRISRYPFTSVANCDLNILSDSQKKHIRKELEINDSFTILYVGQFIPRKGIDILLEALGLCDRSIQAIFIGGEPKEQYLRLIDKLDLKNVRFIGFQSKDMVKTWMQAADIFVLPTRYDIWGLVVNEAMSQGLPVVSSDSCIAAKEMIISWENGVLFENENTKQLASIISELWRTGKWHQMKSSAYHTAEVYTFEKMAEAHFGEW